MTTCPSVHSAEEYTRFAEEVERLAKERPNDRSYWARAVLFRKLAAGRKSTTETDNNFHG